MNDLLADGTKVSSLTREQFVALDKTLLQIHEKLRCPAIFLADMSGVPLVHHGLMPAPQIPILSSLAAADYAATLAMAQLLGESSGFQVHFHEGQDNSIYTSGIDDGHVLTVIFSKNTTFGMVRVLAQRAVNEILKIFSETPSNIEQRNQVAASQVAEQGFQNELSSRLDAALGGKIGTEG